MEDVENFIKTSENKKEIFKALSNKGFYQKMLGKYCPLKDLYGYFNNLDYKYDNATILEGALEADRIEDVCSILRYLESQSLAWILINVCRNTNKEHFIPNLEACVEDIKKLK